MSAPTVDMGALEIDAIRTSRRPATSDPYVDTTEHVEWRCHLLYPHPVRRGHSLSRRTLCRPRHSQGAINICSGTDGWDRTFHHSYSKAPVYVCRVTRP